MARGSMPLAIRKVARFAQMGLLAYRMCANAHDGYEPGLGFSPSLGTLVS